MRLLSGPGMLDFLTAHVVCVNNIPAVFTIEDIDHC